MSELGKSFPTNVDKLKSEIGNGGGSGNVLVAHQIIIDEDENQEGLDITKEQFQSAYENNQDIVVYHETEWGVVQGEVHGKVVCWWYDSDNSTLSAYVAYLPFEISGTAQLVLSYRCYYTSPDSSYVMLQETTG